HRQRTRRPFTASLRLLLWRRHYQAVEFIRHLDLTRQPGIWPDIVTEVEHVLLHRRRTTDFLPPSFIDIDVTCCAGTRATAFCLNAGNIVADRRFHDGRTYLGFDRACGAAGIGISDFGHGKEARNSYAGGNARLLYSHSRRGAIPVTRAK